MKLSEEPAFWEQKRQTARRKLDGLVVNSDDWNKQFEIYLHWGRVIGNQDLGFDLRNFPKPDNWDEIQPEMRIKQCYGQVR